MFVASVNKRRRKSRFGHSLFFLFTVIVALVLFYLYQFLSDVRLGKKESVERFVVSEVQFSQGSMLQNSFAAPDENGSSTISASPSALNESSMTNTNADPEPWAFEPKTTVELLEYIARHSVADLELPLLVHFVEATPEAVNDLITEYLNTSDAHVKQTLEVVLDYLEHPDRTSRALEMALSPNAHERLVAYRWLLYSGETYKPEVSAVLRGALTDHAATDIYSWLVSSLSSDQFANNEQQRLTVLLRLKEFSEGRDIELAKTALAKSVELSKSELVLNQLYDHIAYGELPMQLLAVKLLRHFTKVDATIVVQLNTIMNDPFAPQPLRDQSVATLVSLENSAAAVK